MQSPSILTQQFDYTDPVMNLDPSTAYGTVTLGIAAGVLTSGLLLALGAFITKVVVPWYLALTYNETDLSGLWTLHKNQNGVTYTYSLDLKQAAHSLTGTMTITKSGSPPGPRGDYVQKFEASGSTWEGFVTLTMRSSDRRSLSFATTLLKIQDRGKRLSGVMAFRNLDGEPDSEDLNWIHS